MDRCPNTLCRFEAPLEAAFCPRCGRRLVGVAEQAEANHVVGPADGGLGRADEARRWSLRSDTFLIGCIGVALWWSVVVVLILA